MENLNEMVKQYTFKYKRKINTITAPLKQYLGISAFSYAITKEDGHYCSLGDSPEIQEFFHSEKLYAGSPFCSHPDTIRSGILLFPDLHKLTYKKTLHEALQIRYGLVIVRNRGDAVESCYFDIFLREQINNSSIFLENLEILNQFINHFKKEAKPLIERMLKDGFNVKKAKGPSFLTCDPSNPLSNKDPKIESLLKKILPLSFRERQCLQLFKQGKTAQATGAILGISQRTAEFYIDNIKNKLGCYSKAELLEW